VGRHSEVEGREGNLEGMVESHDGLIMEITKEIGLDYMGDDVEDEEEDEDADNGGDATTHLCSYAPCYRT
jgi:hypothetical protein